MAHDTMLVDRPKAVQPKTLAPSPDELEAEDLASVVWDDERREPEEQEISEFGGMAVARHFRPDLFRSNR